MNSNNKAPLCDADLIKARNDCREMPLGHALEITAARKAIVFREVTVRQ